MTPELAELVGSIESSLTDIADKMEVLSGIEYGMSELIEALKDRKGVDLAPLIKAIQAFKPTITVNVPPQPAPVVQIMPADVNYEWELRIPATSYGMADRVLKITRKAVPLIEHEKEM